MGNHAGAHLGYGFKLEDQKLIDGFGSEEIALPKEFDMIWGGEYEDAQTVFICMKKSITTSYGWSDYKTPVNQNKFEVDSTWNEALAKFAKEHKLRKTKIGWWLVASFG
jgi:hypothetical protein